MLGRFLGIFPRAAHQGTASETGSRDSGILPHQGTGGRVAAEAGRDTELRSWSHSTSSVKPAATGIPRAFGSRWPCPREEFWPREHYFDGCICSPPKTALLFKPCCEENLPFSREKEPGIIFSCQLTALSKGKPGSLDPELRIPARLLPPARWREKSRSFGQRAPGLKPANKMVITRPLEINLDAGVALL